MVGASKKLQAELAIAGHPNAFPSTPKTTTAEWDLLQLFDAGMVCDPSILVPSKNLGTTLQRRRARGRLSTKGSEVGDAGEARARARIVLQAEYRAPRCVYYSVTVCTAYTHRFMRRLPSQLRSWILVMMISRRYSLCRGVLG